MPEGWPTLADVHAAVVAVREDVRGLRAEMRGQRRELELHRADDRRELDELHEGLAQLRGRERWMAGGLAVLGLLVVVGVPTLVTIVGG